MFLQQDVNYKITFTTVSMQIAHNYVGSYIQVTLWLSVEPSVGVTCACLPFCRPVFKICFHSNVTLKESAFGTQLPQSKDRYKTGDHDFARLVGTEGTLPSQGTLMQDFGNHVKIQSNQEAGKFEFDIESGGVHVRRDVEVLEN